METKSSILPVNQSETPIQSPFPEYPVKNQSSTFVIILGVLVLLLIVAGGAYYLGMQKNQTSSQTNQAQNTVPTVATQNSPVPTISPDTAKWEIYTGKTYSIKYPPNFVTGESKSPSSPDYPKGGIYTYFNGDNNGISITEAENSKSLTLEDALGNGPYFSYTKEFITGKPIEEIIVDGVKAKVVKNVPAGLSGNVAVDMVWIKEGLIYQAGAQNESSYETLQKMLSTFKFTQ